MSGSSQTALLAAVRFIQLARELVVIPLLVLLAAACGAYAFVVGRRLYHRYLARRAIVTVAVVAPWLSSNDVETLLQVTQKALVGAGATVLRASSAYDVCRSVRPQALVATDTGAGSESESIRTDERVTFAVSVLRTSLALEHTALVLAAESVKAKAWKRDALQLRNARGRRPTSNVAEEDGQTTVILCNGGVLDADALCTSHAMWTRLWHRTGWRRSALRKRYDAVVVITGGGPSDTADATAAKTTASDDALQPSRRTVAWTAHANAVLVPGRTAEDVAQAVSMAVFDIARKRTAGTLHPVDASAKKAM